MRVSPVEHEIPPDYQYRALVSGWAPQRAWHRARLDLVAELLPPPAHAPSLDAAAGAGILARRFAPAPVVSTDIRIAACAFIRNTHGAPAVAATLAAQPFQSGAFTHIYLLEVIEHLQAGDTRHVLRELRRVCAPRGQCLITTPNYGSHWNVLERGIDALRLTPPMGGEQHVTRYTRDSLSQVMTGAGWKVLRAGTFNFLAPLAGMLSVRAGASAIRREIAGGSRAGALLYALCEPAS